MWCCLLLLLPRHILLIDTSLFSSESVCGLTVLPNSVPESHYCGQSHRTCSASSPWGVIAEKTLKKACETWLTRVRSHTVPSQKGSLTWLDQDRSSHRWLQTWQQQCHRSFASSSQLSFKRWLWGSSHQFLPKGPSARSFPKQRSWEVSLPGGERHLWDLIPRLTYFPLSISPGLSWGGLEWNVVQRKSDGKTLSLDHSAPITTHSDVSKRFLLITFLFFHKKRYICPYPPKDISPWPLLLHYTYC